MIKLVARGYITEGLILLLTYLFSIPKVTKYIHILFDATVRGSKTYVAINRHFLMMMGLKTHMVDLDVW